MRSFLVSILFGVIIAAIFGIKPAYALPADVTICFTPGDRCDMRIISAIESAQRTIEVQAYQLTSKPIQRSLVSAYQRGVKVEIILDKSQAHKPYPRTGYSPYQYFKGIGVPVWIDTKVRIAHNKVMIIDGKEVITGSYNYSRAAQYRNAENIVIIRSSDIARQYQKNFDQRLSVSEK